jgi:hypothetical protein
MRQYGHQDRRGVRILRAIVHYLPEGITLNLGEPGYGHPRGTEIVESLLGKMTRKNPVLVCERHGSPLYLQPRPIRRGSLEYRIWGIHFGGSVCTQESLAGMSDEHRRKTEYIVRAATDAGLRADFEVRLPAGRVRPDAVIYGAVAVAAEVQRSDLTARAAVSRTKKAQAGGMATSLWFHDRELEPLWFFKVPSIGMNKLPWDVMPAKRSATVTTGVREITAVRCAFPDYNICPETRLRPCGKRHPRHSPWMGLTVDDVAVMAPEEALVPILYRYQHPNPVLLVSQRDAELYRDLAGDAGTVELLPEDEQLLADGPRTVECQADPAPVPGPRAPTPPRVLDWSHPMHVGQPGERCMYCGGASQLRDSFGNPAHKVCAERLGGA